MPKTAAPPRLPELPLRRIDSLWHVGELSPEAKRLEMSHEGPCLSVSRHPAEWGRIARLGSNTTWKLSREGAQWIDVHEVPKRTMTALGKWAVAEGLAEPCTIYEVERYDDEIEDTLVSRFLDKEEALDEADLDEDDEDQAATVNERKGLRLTEAGRARLPRYSSEIADRDALLLLAALHLEATRGAEAPVGLWWEDDYDPLVYSCPRGGILPGQVGSFTAVIDPHPPAYGSDEGDIGADEDIEDRDDFEP